MVEHRPADSVCFPLFFVSVIDDIFLCNIKIFPAIKCIFGSFIHWPFDLFPRKQVKRKWICGYVKRWNGIQSKIIKVLTCTSWINNWFFSFCAKTQIKTEIKIEWRSSLGFTIDLCDFLRSQSKKREPKERKSVNISFFCSFPINNGVLSVFIVMVWCQKRPWIFHFHSMNKRLFHEYTSAHSQTTNCVDPCNEQEFISNNKQKIRLS